MVPYDEAYRRRQVDRILAAAKALREREVAVRDGRVVPDHGDLPIGTGRRLHATVLFIDVCGSSNRGSDDHDGQQLALSTMTILFGEMIRIVTDHGGRVEKNTGDGLMAYFAQPRPGWTVQQTALAAAITMTMTADALVGPVLRGMGAEPWPFRICLDHGPLTVAEVGAAGRFRGIVAIGTAANIAVKMLSFADAGSIFVGDALLQGLPAGWREWIGETVTQTGWSYRSGLPYPFHRYIGRWV